MLHSIRTFVATTTKYLTQNSFYWHLIAGSELKRMWNSSTFCYVGLLVDVKCMPSKSYFPLCAVSGTISKWKMWHVSDRKCSQLYSFFFEWNWCFYLNIFRTWWIEKRPHLCNIQYVFFFSKHESKSEKNAIECKLKGFFFVRIINRISLVLQRILCQKWQWALWKWWENVIDFHFVCNLWPV